LDLSDGPKDPARDMERVMDGFRHAHADQPYALFNFEREPFK